CAPARPSNLPRPSSRRRGRVGKQHSPVALTLPQTFGKLDRMPRAYFDANIYIHIARGYISADEVDAVRPSLASRQIEAHLSAADVDEFFGDWEKDRPAVVKRLQVARDLVGFEGILKQPSDLLREGIESYAVGRSAPSPLLSRQQENAYRRPFIGLPPGTSISTAWCPRSSGTCGRSRRSSGPREPMRGPGRSPTSTSRPAIPRRFARSRSRRCGRPEQLGGLRSSLTNSAWPRRVASEASLACSMFGRYDSP